MPCRHREVIPPQGHRPTNTEAAPLPSPSHTKAIPPHVTKTHLSLMDTHFQSGAHTATVPLPIPPPLGLIFCLLSDTEVEVAPCPVVTWTRFCLDPSNTEDPLPLLGRLLSVSSKHHDGAAFTPFHMGRSIGV